MNPPPLSLQANEAPGDGLRRIARKQIDTARAALNNDSDPVRSVHEARKALKKLRAAFRLVSGKLEPRRREVEKEALGEIAHLLGPMRDAEVRLRTLEALIRTAPAEPAEFTAVRTALVADRDRVAASSEETVGRALRLLDKARRRVQTWPTDALTPADLKAEVRRAYRKGRRTLEAYRAQPSPEAFHEWRKRVKELWYHLRIVRAAFSPGKVRRLIMKLKDMGGMAGDAHDLDALRVGVQQLVGPGVQAAFIIGEIDTREPEFYAEALRLGGRFYKKSPRDFIKGLERK
ncbi:MAG: CHAD domain-containing protein [Chthoniobacteraceae bacterium]